MPIKIYPTLTSTNKKNIKTFLEEITALNLKEICLFLTGLTKKERGDLFAKLTKTRLETIPFVHLKSDMEPQELKFLVEKYKTKVFNLHSAKEFPVEYDLAFYKNKIYIENTYFKLDEEEIKGSAGLCVDFSHLEKMRLVSPDIYCHNMRLARKYPIGCSHISACKPPDHKITDHYAENKTDFDYLKKYKKYLPNICAMELENSFKEQLVFRDYIYGII